MRAPIFSILTVGLFLLALGVPQAHAETEPLSAEALFSSALEALAEVPGGLDGDRADLRDVQALLDRIVDEYPASDLAVRILMRETIGRP